MMRRIAHWLLTLGGIAFVASLAVVLIAGIAMFVGFEGAGHIAFTCAALTFFAAIIALIVGYCIDDQLDDWEFERRRALRHPKIPLDPRAKEPGYNDAVIGWFHNGPELREPGEDFAKGFASRAIVPPPRRRG